jgi:hypothetical protein
MSVSSKLFAATANVGVDLNAWAQRIAAPCSALQRATKAGGKTKPPVATPLQQTASDATTVGDDRHATQPLAHDGQECMFDRQGTSDEVSDLSPKQRLAAIWLGEGRSVANVARDVGADRGTIFRWKRLPRFRAEVEVQTRSFIDRRRATGLPVNGAEVIPAKVAQPVPRSSITSNRTPPSPRSALQRPAPAQNEAKSMSSIGTLRLGKTNPPPHALSGRTEPQAGRSFDVVTGLNVAAPTRPRREFTDTLDEMIRKLDEEFEQIIMSRQRHGLQRNDTECSALQRPGGHAQNEANELRERPRDPFATKEMV